MVARLLPPESSAIDLVSREVGISVTTLERWRADALANESAADSPRWTAAARLQAVIVTAAMDEATRSAWCREQGLYPTELDTWKRDAGCDRRPRRAAGGQCRASSAGPPAGQGVGAGAPSQGQGTGRNGRLARSVKKTFGGLPRRRGRMTRLEDRQILVRDIEQARVDGARLAPACALAGIDAATLRRWKVGDGLRKGDQRPDADRPMPSHALS